MGQVVILSNATVIVNSQLPSVMVTFWVISKSLKKSHGYQPAVKVDILSEYKTVAIQAALSRGGSGYHQLHKMEKFANIVFQKRIKKRLK